MIIVTGGAGFIGSNIVKSINEMGRDDILVVDNLKNGKKFINISDCGIADYIDKHDFIEAVSNGDFDSTPIDVIFHQGACSVTTEWDGQYMMKNNFEYSKKLLAFAVNRGIPFIYASSAATYGNGRIFKEDLQFERPLNVYGYSKLLFDQYVRRILPKTNTQIVGLRYFNVYGPRESHKGSMASVAFHLNNQLAVEGDVRLFKGSHGYEDGEQRRDFVYVGDVAKVNLWFWQESNKSGIFNLGTGRSQTFNDVANAVIKWHGKGAIKYVDFPENLVDSYQSFTQADMNALKSAGYKEEFYDVETGVGLYLDWLNGENGS